MRSLERRVTKLEQDVRHEMVFVTYLGNPEPQSLWVGGERLSRRPSELWDDFKDRVQATAPREQFAVGDLSVFERPVD